MLPVLPAGEALSKDVRGDETEASGVLTEQLPGENCTVGSSSRSEDMTSSISAASEGE